MPRSRHSQSRHLEFSGAPSYEAEFASLSSSGFDTSAGLGDLSLLSPAALGHSPFEPYQQHNTISSNVSEYDRSYLGGYQSTAGLGNISEPHQRHAEPYWQNHAALAQDHTPLPSPRLLTANSLNLPPLFSSLQEPNQHVLLSHNVPYDYPAPPDIPYAESAASAASSNLSPPEDEAGPKGPVDEDKRRRNLAASARFREKKKLRERQLEQQSRELSDRAVELEHKIAELQKENDFLKALLTEKETDMTPEGRRKFQEFALLVERGEY